MLCQGSGKNTTRDSGIIICPFCEKSWIKLSKPYHQKIPDHSIPNEIPKDTTIPRYACTSCERLIKENHDLRNKLYILTGESA
jgi:hypothetical protein